MTWGNAQNIIDKQKQDNISKYITYEMNIMWICKWLEGTMNLKLKRGRKEEVCFPGKCQSKEFSKQEREAGKYMLLCISVGEHGSRPGDRWFQSKHIMGSCILVKILGHRVSSLCRHSTKLIYDSEAYQVLWHREGNALASISVFLRTCRCLREY